MEGFFRKTKSILLFGVFIVLILPQRTQAKSLSTPDSLLLNAYKVFEYLRAETGVYTDAIRFQGAQFHPASVSTTGMGLITLCIADSLGIIPDAESLTLETLKSMNGLRAGFNPERNAKGWFRHFIEQATGARAWNSEFSSIDTGILIAGALFAKNYFSDNDSIVNLADSLYLSVEWASMIKDSTSGGIYLIANDQGNGNNGAVTLPFNEYMIVAWLAKNDLRDNVVAEALWNKHYADPNNLPKTLYDNTIPTLADAPGNFLSGFVPQFPYYLCNPFTIDSTYISFLQNHIQADRQSWIDTTGNNQLWGYGAGAANVWVSSGYNADNIKSHPGRVVSPHIIAGAIPVDTNAFNDLLYIANNHPEAIYTLPTTESTPILWRFSHLMPSWEAGDIQGIDFSTFIFGLAAHPDLLGKAFFEQLNDFEFPDGTTSIFENEVLSFSAKAFPNPSKGDIQIQLDLPKPENLDIRIFNQSGQEVYHFPDSNYTQGRHLLNWKASQNTKNSKASGIYLCVISSEKAAKMIRLVIN